MSEEHKNCKYRFKSKSCEDCPLNCKFKRLQEENKRLQMLFCANCGEKYLSPDGAELYEKNVQLKEENEELKKYQYKQEYLQSEIEKRQKALEEIREIYKLTCRDCEYALSCEIENCGNYKLIMIEKTINEVLNDRD